MKVLICTNGSAASRRAFEAGALVAEALHAEAVVLGVVEHPSTTQYVQHAMEGASAILTARNVAHTTRVREGAAVAEIAAEAAAGDYLTVAGPLGRSRLIRTVRRTSIWRLLGEIDDPVLIVREPRAVLRSVLICSGGLGCTDAAVRLAGEIAQGAGAAVTLLHVWTPNRLLEQGWMRRRPDSEAFLKSDAIQAHHLRDEIALLQELGLQPTFTLRSGQALDEILAETRAGDYDMVAIGSTVSAGLLVKVAVGGITDKVARRARRPVLVVR
jgi:nucleotide-binding universal stress UspA family protein